MIPAEIVNAIKDVRGKVKSLKKEDFNPHGNYKYVSIDTYYEKVLPLANEVGLIWRIKELAYDLMEGQGRNKDTAWVKARYAFDLHKDAHEAPEYMTVTILAPVAGAQTAGQLYSYADKVFMRVAFGVPTGESDADANEPQTLAVTGSSPKAVDPIQSPNSAYMPKSAVTPAMPDIPTFMDRGLPPHDATTGELKEEPKLLDHEKVAPTKSKMGDPIFDTKSINKDNCELIFQIFKHWMPQIKNKAQLTDWHALNLAAIHIVKTHDPAKHDEIKALFNGRNAELRLQEEAKKQQKDK